MMPGGDTPTCTVRAASAAELRAWAGRAKAGERFVYLTAPAMVQLAVCRTAAALYRAGAVDLVSASARASVGPGAGLAAGGGNEQCREWMAVRLGPRGGRGRRARLAVRDAAAATILAVLRRAAEAGRPCPSDAQLARVARLATRKQAEWRVRKLVAEGRIRTEIWPGPAGPVRVVEIAASGRRTLSPSPPAAGSAAGGAAALDAGRGGAA